MSGVDEAEHVVDVLTGDRVAGRPELRISLPHLGDGLGTVQEVHLVAGLHDLDDGALGGVEDIREHPRFGLVRHRSRGPST